MSGTSTIKAIWMGLQQQAFSPVWLSSRNPELNHKRKLIRYALSNELGWTFYQIAKAEYEAIGKELDADYRKKNVSISIRKVSKEERASDLYRHIVRMLIRNESTIMDTTAELMEERTLSLAFLVAVMLDDGLITKDQLHQRLEDARATSIYSLRSSIKCGPIG